MSEYYDYEVAHAMSGAGVGGFNLRLTGKDKANNNSLEREVYVNGARDTLPILALVIADVPE